MGAFGRGYFNGCDPYGYDVYPVSPERHVAVARMVVAAGRPSAAVLGCASGQTLKALEALGVSAQGCDISAYARSCAEPDIRERITRLDVRNTLALREWLGDGGLAITEQLLPCLTDAEALALHDALTDLCDEVWHLVIAHRIAAPEPCPLNTAGRQPDAEGAVQLRTAPEWRELLGPDAQIYMPAVGGWAVA